MHQAGKVLLQLIFFVLFSTFKCWTRVYEESAVNCDFKIVSWYKRITVRVSGSDRYTAQFNISFPTISQSWRKCAKHWPFNKHLPEIFNALYYLQENLGTDKPCNIQGSITLYSTKATFGMKIEFVSWLMDTVRLYFLGLHPVVSIITIFLGSVNHNCTFRMFLYYYYYVPTTCFGPYGPSSGGIGSNQRIYSIRNM
jgi:hypothetical protein